MTRTTATEIEQRRFEQAIANRRRYRLEPLGEVFAHVLQGAGAERASQAALEEAWRQAAPQAVRSTTRVERFESGVLHVVVADPVTRFALLGERTMLRDRLRRWLPRLRAIRFGLDENGFGKRQDE